MSDDSCSTCRGTAGSCIEHGTIVYLGEYQKLVERLRADLEWERQARQLNREQGQAWESGLRELEAELQSERQARERVEATLKAVMEDRDREQEQHGKWFRQAAIAEGKLALYQGRAEAAEQRAREAEAAHQRAVDGAVDVLTTLSCDRHVAEVRGKPFAAYYEEEVARGCHYCRYEQLEAVEQGRREAEAAVAVARVYLWQLCHHCDESKPTSECIACQSRAWLESNDAGAALLAQIEAGKKALVRAVGDLRAIASVPELLHPEVLTSVRQTIVEIDAALAGWQEASK